MEITNKDVFLKKVGEKLRNIRKERQMEVKVVVKALKISPQAYSNIENGKVDLNVSRLAAIANLFEVSADEILNTGVNFDLKAKGTDGLSDGSISEYLKNELGLLRSRMEAIESFLLPKT